MSAAGGKPMGNSRAVRVRRVYDHRVRGDGTRVLVDRIWPRGMTKQTADLDEWCKQIAPSNELRKWYNHAPERFEEFTRRYQEELTAARTRGSPGPLTRTSKREDTDTAYGEQGR